MDDVSRATDYLHQKGIGTCDEIEQLPGGDMHWIADPAGTVFILKKKD